jgi:hypothetical protein
VFEIVHDATAWNAQAPHDHRARRLNTTSQLSAWNMLVSLFVNILRPVFGLFVPGRSSLHGLARRFVGAAEATGQNR